MAADKVLTDLARHYIATLPPVRQTIYFSFDFGFF